MNPQDISNYDSRCTFYFNELNDGYSWYDIVEIIFNKSVYIIKQNKTLFKLLFIVYLIIKNN